MAAGWGGMLAGVALGVAATAGLTLTGAGAELWTRTGALLADRPEPGTAAPPAAHGPERALPVVRTAVEGGRVLVRLTDAERERIGVETAHLTSRAHAVEIQAYGSVLDIARVTELTNSYASARAQLQTAQAKAEVSRSANLRARNLGQYATRVQVETAEGTFQTDQAALAAAQSQVGTLAATARQEWGPVIGRAIIERSGLVTRLIERTDFLVQVTLPPGETLKLSPASAFAEVPPQSERVPLAYVSPATRTDQRIQGVSSFYIVAGDSGLLPGMSVSAFLTSPRHASGIAVPESAVVHWQGGAWIYRSVGKDAFARHRITVDVPMSEDSFVIADLGSESEIVVTGPQAVLSEEMRSQGTEVGDGDDD